MLYGVKDCPGCRENFLTALARHGMDRRDIVPNVNFFTRVPIQRSGGAAIARGDSLPGSHVVLRAEMDVLAVISNCPQVNNPCNEIGSDSARAFFFVCAFQVITPQRIPAPHLVGTHMPRIRHGHQDHRAKPRAQKGWSAGRRGMPQSMHQSRPTQPANLREAADPGNPQANALIDNRRRT
jgi:hypothetical protein